MQEIDNNKVLDVLRTVIDPVSGQDIIRTQRIQDFKVRGKEISFSLKAQELDAKIRQQLHFACLEKLQTEFPEAQVHVHMVTQKKEGAGAVLPQVRNIIAIASGKGGVGKSTVSVNVALGLKEKGARVGILDADLYGPSVPIMMGLKGRRPQVQNVYGKPKIIPIEKDGLYVMSIGFVVEPEQAVILRGPRLSGIIKQFIYECLWPELDYLIVDLPPGTGDIQLTLVQTLPVTGSVIVTTPQEVAVADAVKAMNMFRLSNIKVPILGVVENMSWFTPAELPDNKYYLFGQGGGKRLAKMAKSVLLGQIPLVQAVREAGDDGTAVMDKKHGRIYDAFTKVSENLMREVALRNEQFGPTRVVKVDR